MDIVLFGGENRATTQTGAATCIMWSWSRTNIIHSRITVQLTHAPAGGRRWFP
jgi:hypothetical protein